MGVEVTDHPASAVDEDDSGGRLRAAFRQVEVQLEPALAAGSVFDIEDLLDACRRGDVPGVNQLEPAEQDRGHDSLIICVTFRHRRRAARRESRNEGTQAEDHGPESSIPNHLQLL